MYLIYINIYKTQPLAILLKPHVFAVTVTDDIMFLWFIQWSLIPFEVYSASEQRTIYGCNYTGRFIMFSVITNIYNKKTKGPTLMELFTAIGKLKKFFLTTRDVRCLHRGWHDTHRYVTQVLATHASTWVHRYSSTLQWSVLFGQRGHVAMVGRIPGLWHIPKEKNHRA